MPSPETIKKALSAIKRAADYEYFFNQLKSPDWLKPLLEAGFFRSPPDPIRDGQYISYPAWPESRYLARMAKLQPETVVEIALQIPDTENSRVHEDIIDAVLAMPPQLAVRLMPKVRAWAESAHLFILPEKLGELVSHLARGGQAAAALELARVLLAVIPPPQTKIDLAIEPYRLRPEAEVRFDMWHYQEILKKNYPDVVMAAGGDAFVLLCDLLDAAVTISRHETEDEKEAHDYSYVWRPAIEDHPQNHDHGVRHLLVSAVRDAVEQLTRANSEILPKLIGMLEERRWLIFRRIALHVLRLFPDQAEGIIQQRLTDRAYFDNLTLHHEYYLLLQSQFRKLDEVKRAEMLGWIDEGPDLKTVKENQREITGKEPTNEQLANYAHRWRLRKLSPIKADLPPEWKGYYEKWVAEFGEPEHPEFTSYMTSWVGPTSPKGDEELRTMSVEELVAFLKNWKPTDEHMAPSPEGLGRQLTSIVALDPQRFADAAKRFTILDPTYVRGIISGFHDATREKRSFQWLPVLELCLWVVNQPREIEGRKSEYSDLDPGWLWARKRIAELLEVGFDADQGGIPFDLRDLTWRVLQPITDDPEPTPEYEKRYGGSNMDPATLSINTTRPQAIHAAVRYALWVHRNLKKSGKRENVGITFDDISEVREVLDVHLDPAKDPSLAVRAVYGQWFPMLVSLDPKWATENAIKVFPLDESQRDFFDAAWNTYVIFCNAYNNVLEILRPQYATAVENLAVKPKDREQAYSPHEHLAAHLMNFYWSGKLGLEDPIFACFWTKADDGLRAHALDFIGRGLSHTESITVELVERLQKLWHQRVEVAKVSSQIQNYKNELASFGSWFASGKFNDDWAIEQLKQVIKLVNKIEPDHVVVERLAKIVGAMPLEAVECLRLIVDTDTERWGIYSWRDDAEVILSTAIRGTNSEAKSAAIELIHHLGAKGYSDFRGLLPNPTAS